jgi:hypothetical protein
MMEKRLVILLWLTNEESDQEVIGQVNIKMRDAFSHLSLQQLQAQGSGACLKGVITN